MEQNVTKKIESSINQRIKILRSRKKLSQEEFSELIGISRETLAAIEVGKQLPTLKHIKEIVKICNTDYDWLLDGIKPELVNRNTQIPVIDQMAVAGWPSNFKDPEFYTNQPTVSLPWPEFKSGEFVLIQVAGDSMHPTVFNGDWLFCRHLLSPSDIRYGQVYVLILRDGVVCKRLKKAEDRERVVLVSDNPIYDPYEIAGSDILGVWEVKYKMTAVLSMPGSNLESKIETLEKNLIDLKKVILAEKKK